MRCHRTRLVDIRLLEEPWEMVIQLTHHATILILPAPLLAEVARNSEVDEDVVFAGEGSGIKSSDDTEPNSIV